jgi:archaellum component FlaG (FlaF/FlaG flagellin family)
VSKILLMIVAALSVALLYGCERASKWRADMPDDGTMLCSMAGEGFVVVNNPWGFRVDRNSAFNSECAKRVK